MASWTLEPESAAAALIVSALNALDLSGAILQAGGSTSLAHHVPTCELIHWSRRLTPGAVVQAEPPAGPYTAAILRLPKSRDEQLMATHQCLAALTPTGRLIVYGGNDEGVRSFQKNLATLGSVSTVAARGHGRILELARNNLTAPLRPGLIDWRTIGGSRSWVSYPGLFAGGAADPGTALLLAHLPPLSPTAKILDYGCGPGAISAHLKDTYSQAKLTLLDNDSVALVAAAENVPAVTVQLGDALAAATGGPFDMIVSNPPLHSSFKEDLTALHQLIATAPSHLAPKGLLILVVQRRIALDRALAAAFPQVSTLADDGRYRVWLAQRR